MTKISAAEVSRKWNIDKSKVSRALKNGELSGDKGPNGRGYAIEVSEAERWATSLKSLSVRGQIAGSATPSDTPAAPPDETFKELIELRAEVKMQRKLIETLETDKEDWKNQAKHLLLTDQRAPKQGLWSRILGKES